MPPDHCPPCPTTAVSVRLFTRYYSRVYAVCAVCLTHPGHPIDTDTGTPQSAITYRHRTPVVHQYSISVRIDAQTTLPQSVDLSIRVVVCQSVKSQYGGVLITYLPPTPPLSGGFHRFLLCHPREDALKPPHSGGPLNASRTHGRAPGTPAHSETCQIA